MGVGGGGAGVASCVGGVAGIDKSITRTAWSCARDGEAMSGVFPRVCAAGRAGGPARRRMLTGGISRKMAEGMGAGGAGTGARGGVWGGVRVPAWWCARCRASRWSARASATSPRVGRWRRGNSETEKEIRLPIGARAMLRVSPRGSETDEPGAALDGARLVVSFAAKRSRATRVLDAERSAE